MKKIFSYFNTLLPALIIGVIIIIGSDHIGFMSKKFGTLGVYAQALINAVGYGFILWGVLKQKDEWLFFDDYPFKSKLSRFKFFKKNTENFEKRKKKASNKIKR